MTLLGITSEPVGTYEDMVSQTIEKDQVWGLTDIRNQSGLLESIVAVHPGPITAQNKSLPLIGHAS